MRILSLWRILRFYLNHPLGRLDRGGTLIRMLRWQIGSRLLRVGVAMPFVDGTHLLVRKGMHGATGNIYVGLMEFEDMAFVLHLIRQDDMFIDVGANVGVFSILAASRGARVLSFEPVPATYKCLLDNVYLNRFDTRIETKNIGVGSQPGQLRFSTSMGATNHVISDGEPISDSVTVAVKTLDECCHAEATMLKIDVEGFETEVICGASTLLQNEALKAVLIELNGLGNRYGFNDEAIHHRLLDFGFTPVHYDPFLRKLVSLSNYKNTGNTLYVRHAKEIEEKLQKSSPIVWGKIRI